MKKILLINLIPFICFAQVKTTYYPNGKKKEEGRIINDSVKVGLWLSWHDNGQLADSGEYVMFTKDKIRFFIGDPTYTADTISIRDKWADKTFMPSGKWISYYANGKKMMEGVYKPFCSLRIDFVADIDASGNQRILYSIPFAPVADKTGTWKYYNEDGTLDQEEKYDPSGKLIEPK